MRHPVTDVVLRDASKEMLYHHISSLAENIAKVKFRK
jgi:hypothetical protein